LNFAWSAVVARVVLSHGPKLRHGFAWITRNGTPAVYGLTDQTLDGWNDVGLTWAAAPGNDTASHTGTDLASTTLLGTFSIVGAGTVGNTVSVAGQPLVDFLNADTNDYATFIAVRTTQGDTTDTIVHGFASEDHATAAAPTLTVEVPEPGALSMIVAGSIAQLHRRRRR